MLSAENKLSSRKLKIRKRRALLILRKLKKLFPHPKTALRYDNDWELLVAVILSAQCTDKKVNEVTKKLFKKYKKFDDYVDANVNEFEQDIRQTGFYRNKAKHILAASKIVKEKFAGKIPKTMNELLEIPGVARKTANVVLGNAYGIVEGIAVDTHVKRFAQKFNLTDSTNPEKIEQDLMILLPKEEWFGITHRLIEYGRNFCPARKHECRNHPLTKIYPRAAHHWPFSR
jgi:endonuclease III